MVRTLVGLSLLAATALAGDNLLQNGGFEKGGRGWIPGFFSGMARMEFDKQQKVSGKQAMHFIKSGGGGVDTCQQNFEFDAKLRGGKFRVTAHIMAKDVQQVRIMFLMYKPGVDAPVFDKVLLDKRGSFKWMKIDETLKTPKRAESGRILMQVFGKGDVWLDDVAVEAGGGRRKGGKKEAGPKPLDKRTKDWLDKNAVKIRTLDVKGPRDDLAPLKEILKDVRVVQLGEQTHGDGASFQAKARLVRWLHEEMGFNVIAWESGFFECDRANELIGPDKDPKEAMRASIFGIWHTVHTHSVFKYLAATAGTRNPMVLAGYDPQASGRGAREFLPRFVTFMKAGGADMTAWEKPEPQRRQRQPGEKNLARNGGFESKDQGWVLVEQTGNAKFRIADEGAVEGKRTLHVEKARKFSSVDSAFLNFDLPQENRTGVLHVSAQVKGKELGNAWLRCFLYDAAGKALNKKVDLNAGALNGTFEWKTLEKSYAIPEGAVKGRILLNVYMGDQLWLDDVQVVWAKADPKKAAPLTPGVALWKLNDSMFGAGPHRLDENTRNAGLAALDTLAKLLDGKRADLVKGHGKRETEFFEKALENFKVTESLRHSSGRELTSQKEKKKQSRWYGRVRDEMMAKNLIWLAEKRFPGEKIINWAATFHQAHNHKSIRVGGSTSFYKDVYSQGQMVHEHFQEKVYTIGFCAYGGRAGHWFRDKWDLAKPRANSFEDIFRRYGAPLLFVNLRGKNPFNKPMYLTVMGGGRDMQARWANVIDGIFYTEESFPAAGMGE